MAYAATESEALATSAATTVIGAIVRAERSGKSSVILSQKFGLHDVESGR